MKNKAKENKKWDILFYIGFAIIIIGLFVGVYCFGRFCTDIKEYEITFISCEFNEEYQKPKLRVSYIDENNEHQYVEKYKLTELEEYIISLGIDEDFNCNAYSVFIQVETNRFRQAYNNFVGHYNWCLAID